MVLRTEDQDAAQPADQVLPAWEAVASVQRNDQLPCWFVTQPDHARVSGVIAANFDRQRFPQLTDEIIKAIGLHDEGWEAFDGSSPEPRPVILAKGGHALPFIALPPDYYLRAWRSSIARAERLGPLAGLVVSRHFQALGRFGLARPELQPAAADQVKQFLEEELRRESRLMPPEDGTPEDVVRLSLAVLQFCDLLSLHLCSNAPHPVEFPQEFGCGRVSLRRQGSRVALSPSPLAGPVVITFHAFLAESNRTVRRRRSVELQLS